MITGSLESVERAVMGSELLVAALPGAMSLQVENAQDFNEDGGELLLNDNTLEYGSADTDLDVVYLVAPLPVAADIDDPVQVLEGGVLAVEWTANVARDEGDPVAANIPSLLVPYFPEGQYDEVMQVRLQLTDDGEYDVAGQPQRDASFDGVAVWNPHTFADIAGDTASNNAYATVDTWTLRETDGVAEQANGEWVILYPGVYAISFQVAFQANPNGRRRGRVLVNANTSVPVLFRSIAPDPGVVDYVGAARDVRLAEQDVVRVEVLQDSGAALGFGATYGSSHFSMHRVSV